MKGILSAGARRVGLTLGLALAVSAVAAPCALADTSTAVWTPPTQATSTTFQKDGATYRYVTAGTSGYSYDEEALEYLGVCNTVTRADKFSDTSTSNYMKNSILGVWGSAANTNADPYIANLFYNYYVDASGIAATQKSSEAALVNSDPAKVVEGTGVSTTFVFRPDLVYIDSSEISTFDTQVKAINAFATDSEYYKAKSSTYVGDTAYNPVIGVDAGSYGIPPMIASVENAAQSIDDVMSLGKTSGVNLATRYVDDPMSTAIKFEKIVRAPQWYTLEKIADGTVKKKTVAYVYGVTDANNIELMANDDPMTGGRFFQMMSRDVEATTTNLANTVAAEQGDTDPYQVNVTIDQLATADVIIMAWPVNYGYQNSIGLGRDGKAVENAASIKTMLNTAGYTDKANQVIMTGVGTTLEGTGMPSLGLAQAYVWATCFIYPELFNMVDMTAYYYQNFYHISSDSLNAALTVNIKDYLTLPAGQSLDDLKSYDSKKIDAMLDEGTSYYFANSDSIDFSYPYLEASSYLKGSNFQLTRLAGDNRFTTMKKIVNKGFGAADTVVIASSTSYADALSAAGLAGSKQAPILITDKANLSPETADTIKDLGAKNAIIVGGTSAVSSDVESSLKALGLSTSRVAGDSRMATACAVAGGLDSQVAIVATGFNFADALSISPYAYSAGIPIYLTDGTGMLDADTANAVMSAGYSKVIIVGGAKAVSDDNQKNGYFGNAEVVRLSGENRYQTSNKIASYLVSNRLAVADGFALATGADFPDALTGAALCGKGQSVLLLVSASDKTCVDGFLVDNATSINSGYVFGGTGVVDNATCTYVQNKLSQ